MKVTRIVSQVSVVGRIWWPYGGLCATDYPLNDYDIDHMRDDDGVITRKSVQSWLDTHAGDFSEVVDFRATIGDGEFDCEWSDEENELVYNGAMFGWEE